MRNIAITVSIILLIGLVTAGCSDSQKLSGKFDESEVKKEAREVIELVNAGDYQKLSDEKWSTVLKSTLPAEDIESGVKPVVDELGAFKSFEKDAVTGSKDKDTDQEYAVCVVKVKYEKRNAQYTISFDEDMKVAGFFVK